jgi:hypothetical protein
MAPASKIILNKIKIMYKSSEHVIKEPKFISSVNLENLIVCVLMDINFACCFQ